ncbi:zinc finger FYVE domain-containing protein 21-like [Physella acuta]|uniref:zinc finger FYVE domain-containing protein 21-like n=1 Tax=Physella acuta TaxID=109671 RepID=UPI0027DC3F22|nr:zinc finger FYVE domain-containing protein 21-like [Physella acuta]
MATSDKRLVKSKSGLRMMYMDERIQSPFVIQEPPWTDSTQCEKCQVKFDFIKRKHHCRRCGKCLCDSCCKNQATLPRMGFIDPVRHCQSCMTITKKENEFFDKHIKTLLAGGQFKLYRDDDDSEYLSGNVIKCALSTDHRYLQFEGDVEGLENIYIGKLESVQIAAVSIDHQGNRFGTGIAIRYVNALGNTAMIKLNVDDGAAHKQSTAWVAAMHKAFTLVYESRKTNT